MVSSFNEIFKHLFQFYTLINIIMIKKNLLIPLLKVRKKIRIV